MIVTEVRKEQEITDLFAVEYIEERDTRVDLSVTRSETETILLFGNKKELRQNTSQLLVAFIEIMRNHVTHFTRGQRLKMAMFLSRAINDRNNFYNLNNVKT